MRGLWRRGSIAALVAAAWMAAASGPRASAAPTPPRPPAAWTAGARADTAAADTVVFSGGCFWGVQAVFQRVRGVEVATAGYAGGSASTATYAQTSTGRTGHAESVRVVFDPDRVSYGTLLRLFFTVVHDPTQKNRQGPDIGTQYRSAIWTTSQRQARRARDFIERLEKVGVFPRPIVTEVHPLDGFYPAEEYHQDYLLHHPDQPYIVVNDLPKVRALRRDFPGLWREDPAPWRAAGREREP